MKQVYRYISTVFISGTFADMVVWRQEARNVLTDLKILPIDLSNGVKIHVQTEDYINSDLDDADAYLGIYGHRYGSRVNDDNSKLSWTHYEYTRHMKRVRSLPHGSGQPGTKILVPAKPSEAIDIAIDEANRVFDDCGLTPEERTLDQELQNRFINVVRGKESNFTTSDDLPPPPKVDPVLGNKIFAEFANATELREEILKFTYVIAMARQRIPEHDTPATVAAPPPPPLPLPLLTQLLLKRLAPEKRPVGICVVAPRFEGIRAQEVSEAIAVANPWGVADCDHLIDVGGERDTDLLQIMQEYADSQLGVDGDDFKQLSLNIARDIAEREYPEMFRFDNLPPGFVTRFLRDVWPTLEADLCSERAKSKQDKAGLLLILSSEADLQQFKAKCQFASAAAKLPSTPILIDAKSLDFASCHASDPINEKSPL